MIGAEDAAAIRDALALVQIIQRHGSEGLAGNDEAFEEVDAITGSVSFDHLSRMVGVLVLLAARSTDPDELYEFALKAIGASE